MFQIETALLKFDGGMSNSQDEGDKTSVVKRYVHSSRTFLILHSLYPTDSSTARLDKFSEFRLIIINPGLPSSRRWISSLICW